MYISIFKSIHHHNKCLDIVCELPPCSFGCSSSAACGWRPLAPAPGRAPGCWGGLSRSRQHPDEWRWGGIMVWMNKSKGRERLCSAFVMIPPPTINVVIVWEKNRAMKSVRIWEKIVWGSDKEPGIPSCGGFQGQPLEASPLLIQCGSLKRKIVAVSFFVMSPLCQKKSWDLTRLWAAITLV